MELDLSQYYVYKQADDLSVCMLQEGGGIDTA